MRRCLLVVALILAGCGGKAAGPSSAASHRDEILQMMQGASIGYRVDQLDVVPDGDREVIRAVVSTTYDTHDGVLGVGWLIATRIAPLWDGNEANGSSVNLDLILTSDQTPTVHVVCKGEVMDRVESRRITEADWRTACGV